MSDASLATDSATAQDRDAFNGRMIRDLSGVMSIFSIYVGVRLGLYKSLVESGPSTSLELAARTVTHERYIREWLEQQTVTNILEVDDENLAPLQRRYSLPPGRAESLTDSDSPNYQGSLALVIVGAVKPISDVLEAYRHGGGVPFDAYGNDLREGQAIGNRWGFLNQLSQEWLPLMPDVHSRLQADPSAKVADFGCGFGWSSIGMAKGYPKIHVDGFDLDGPSIDQACKNATANQVADRISFQVRDASDPALAGKYDLVTAFECVHDLSDPVGALSSMRRLTKEHGTVLIMDERVGDSFTAQGMETEWIMYGSSVLHCLPVGMSGLNSAATGAVMRPNTLREYALQAGFRDVEILPIDNFLFRFYRLIQ